jgi:hypothetical protein
MILKIILCLLSVLLVLLILSTSHVLVKGLHEENQNLMEELRVWRGCLRQF